MSRIPYEPHEDEVIKSQRMLESDDPKERASASGYIPGMGKNDPTLNARIRRGSSKVGAGK